MPPRGTQIGGPFKRVGDTLVSSGPIAESLACVYGDESAASGNTTKLQAALDAKSLALTAPGIVYINDTLIFDSDTRIEIGLGVTIRMVGGINRPLFRTAAYSRMKTAPNACTATMVNGVYKYALTITGAVAHGLKVGDWVWLDRPTAVGANAKWNGVHRVESITNATDFVLLMKYPTIGAATFSANWVRATQNVTLDCPGTIDYNYIGPPLAGGSLDGFGFMLVGTANVHGRAPAIENAFNYAWYSLASAENRIINPRAKYTYKDGVKVYGPSFDDYYEDIDFDAQDDVFSCQGKEPATYAAFQEWWGDVNNLAVDGVYGKSRLASVCAIYGSNNAFMDSIKISNVHGSCELGANAAMRIAAGSGESPTTYQFGLIEISNVIAGRGLTQTLSSVRARDIRHYNVLDTYQAFAAFAESGTNIIDSYTIDTLRVKTTIGSGEAFAIALGPESGGTSTYGRVVIRNCSLEGGTNLLVARPTATVKTALIVENLTNIGASRPIDIQSANVPLIVDGAYMALASSYIARASVACSVAFRRISGAFASLMELAGSSTFSVDLSADESVTPTLSTGIVTHTNANASLRRVKLPVALPVSLSSAWLSRTSGSQVTASANTGSGGSTDILAGNTAICDATGVAGSWRQISAPTRQY